PREDGEDRLLLELSVERGRADDDGNHESVEGDRRSAEIGYDARRVPEGELTDRNRVERRSERKGAEAQQNPGANGLPVGVEGDGGDSSEHGRPFSLCGAKLSPSGTGFEVTTHEQGRTESATADLVLEEAFEEAGA